MSLSLPQPSAQYDQNNEAQARSEMMRADDQNMKKTQDVDISKRRLILQSPDGNLWSVTVGNTGTLSAVAL